MTEGFSRPAETPDPLGTAPTTGVPGAGAHVAAQPPVYPPAGGSSGTSGTRETAKQEAAAVAQTAGESAREVKDVAKDQAKETAAVAKDKAKETVAEAKYQVRDLVDQGRGQLREQASGQQQRLAGGFRSFSTQLGSMAEGAQEEGMAADLTRRASSYADRAGQWLESREPADLLDEVTSYARRHPGTFLAIAAGLGLLAGRVARSLKDESSEPDVSRAGYAGTAGYPGDYGTGARGQYGETTTEYAAGYGTPTGTGYDTGVSTGATDYPTEERYGTRTTGTYGTGEVR
ncbi:hypothetical protein [Georgenia sp. SYP-B2076]|uniref:hypothetical protein n=1 Tax=Georgenia sp. SYP-B2076 TaxID=2495881 RepID=UPI000F8ED93D|nr:hypothetical protein [Georgenia sp. SYP-B2076]